MAEEKKEKKEEGCPLCNVSEETLERLKSSPKKEGEKNKESIKRN